MNELELIEPLDIDHAELAGLSPQLVFCMGWELHDVRESLRSGDQITMTILKANASRVKRMCIRRGRKFRVSAIPNSKDWVVLTVAPVQDGE